MSNKLHVLEKQDAKSRIHQEQCEFRKDVSVGLSKSKKELSSKYFYDDQGSDLFNQITRHPDYYPTSCELEILEKHKVHLAGILRNEAFNLIELGPGEGIKTQILAEEFCQQSLSFTYTPIDISLSYLQKIICRLETHLPEIEIDALNSDYFKGLEWLNVNSSRRNVVLFLGSSIGNFDLLGAEIFLKHLWQVLHDGDYVLIGFDLKKDVDMLIRAYNDSDGITREFNMNLLRRMNKELGADFNFEQFAHHPTYNVRTGAMESYILSLASQRVEIAALGQSFKFDAYEPIHVEFSYKYLPAQIQQFAKVTGFEVVKLFTDTKGFFIDALWRVKKK